MFKFFKKKELVPSSTLKQSSEPVKEYQERSDNNKICPSCNSLRVNAKKHPLMEYTLCLDCGTMFVTKRQLLRNAKAE